MSTSRDLSAAVSRAIKRVGRLDLLIYYLKIEKGVATKDIREMTGLSQDKLNRRLQKIYSKIREEVGANLIN